MAGRAHGRGSSDSYFRRSVKACERRPLLIATGNCTSLESRAWGKAPSSVLGSAFPCLGNPGAGSSWGCTEQRCNSVMNTCGGNAALRVLPGSVAALCSPARPCCANKGPVAELPGVDQPARDSSICGVLQVPGPVPITCPQHLQWHRCGQGK